MATKDTTAIVNELIELEPTLAQHRGQLEKSVAAILKAKPNVKITPAFKQKLLSDLHAVIATSPQSLSPFTRMQKFLYAVSGAAVASIALYVTVINPQLLTPTPAPQGDGMMEEMAMDSANKKMVTRPQSGGGGDHAVGYAGGGGGGGIPAMADSRMIAPGEMYPYTTLIFKYDGEVTLPEADTLQSFKRNPLKSPSKANLLAGTFVSDLMDVSTLGSLSVTNVNLSEAGSEPLMVNVDFNEGYISINRQINYALRPESKCQDEDCYQQYRLKERDMISDERAMEIAGEFLDRLGVNIDGYGEPLLQDDWRMRFESEPSQADFYFPEQLSVTYPYLVNGLPVYDEWGNPNGMTVTVDVRLRAATGMWGLRTMDLTKEDTGPFTEDVERVKKALTHGGVSMGYIDENAKQLEATLGTPSLVYINHYVWEQETQTGYETYVPALYFPVDVMPKDTYQYRRAVVIPLAENLLETAEMPPTPMPLPMPVEPLEKMEGGTDMME